MKIKTKLIVSFLGIIVLLVGLSFYSATISKSLLLDSVRNSSQHLAGEILKRITDGVFSRIQSVETLSESPMLIDAISRSNTEFGKIDDVEKIIRERDREWTSTSRRKPDPFQDTLVSRILSKELVKRFIEPSVEKYGYKIITEIFVTNKYGANVLMTGITSDYRQDDEYWWREARKNGGYIGPISYDESSSVYGIPIAKRVNDENGEFAGVVKAVISVLELIKQVEIFTRKQKTREIILITEDGRLIFHTRLYRFLEDVSNHGYYRSIQRNEQFFLSKSGKIFIHERSKKKIGGDAHINWILITSYEAEEILRPVAILQRKILLISLILVVIGILITMAVSSNISRPIVRLKEAANAIGDGRLETPIHVEASDEVGDLAASFKAMIAKLIESKDALNDLLLEKEERARELLESERSLRAGKEALSLAQSIGKTGSWNVHLPSGGTTWSDEMYRIMNIDPGVDGNLSDIFYNMLHRDDASILREKIDLLVAAGNFSPVELRAAGGDGADLILYVHARIIQNEDGGDRNIIGICRDVREQKLTRDFMVQTEKMLSVGGLAAGMAHEINNPLAGMIQTANVMKGRLTDLEMPANRRAAKEFGVPMESLKAFMEKRGVPAMITTINESGRRMARIVDNMLSSSRNMADLMDKILELAATDYDLKKQYDFKSITIVKEYEDRRTLVPCEGAKIQQVLLNILTNGAQAMQERDDGETPCFVLRLRKETEARMFRIEIEDNGPGMDEPVRKRIFEPFFTTKSVGIGTGLGLSVSYFIITENHGGSMDATSEPGKGAIFIIRLPLERKGAEG